MQKQVIAMHLLSFTRGKRWETSQTCLWTVTPAVRSLDAGIPGDSRFGKKVGRSHPFNKDEKWRQPQVESPTPGGESGPQLPPYQRHVSRHGFFSPQFRRVPVTKVRAHQKSETWDRAGQLAATAGRLPCWKKKTSQKMKGSDLGKINLSDI